MIWRRNRGHPNLTSETHTLRRRTEKPHLMDIMSNGKNIKNR